MGVAVGRRAVARGEAVEHGAVREGHDLVAADLAGDRFRGARREEGGEFHPLEARRITDFERGRSGRQCGRMDTSAITAAAQASSSSYRSFADATRAVLDLLERHMPEATLFLAHLDRGQFIHRIVDTRKGGEFGLRSNLATPLGDAFCSHMAEDRAPRLCDDVGKQPVYRSLAMQQRMDAASYLGVPLELSDGTRVGSLGALSREYCAFEPADEQLFLMLARVLASELERESNERDLRRFNDMLRDQARGMGAVGRVAKALAAGEDARTRRLRGRLRGRGRARRVPARAERPRVHLDRDGRRRHRPGDDPAARGPDRPGPRVHRQGDLLRRRRAHAPGARRAAGGGDRGPLRRVRAGPARRRRRRRADRDLARAAGGAARRARAACCGCWPRRPPWRSSTPRCASGSPASRSPTR